MKKMLLRNLVILMAVIFLAAVYGTDSCAKEDEDTHEASFPLLEAGPGFDDMYIIQLSGTVGNERFEGAHALLHIGAADDFDPNTYVMTIEGYPRLNSRNTFFWDSKDAPMTTVSNQLKSRVTRSVIGLPNIHFFYLSPVLLENQGMETQHEERRLAEAEAAALPTLIKARAGELDLRIYGTTLSGTIWLKGYDVIEQSYVLYRAQIHGRRAHREVSKRKKRD
jgi:hypothetical protein